MKCALSRELFENHSNIKLHRKPSSWCRVVPWGRTDGEIRRS